MPHNPGADATANPRRPSPAAPPHPSDPTRLGDYRLLGRLGAGGMGIVYLGRSTRGSYAAIKAVRADLADDPEFRARFRHEVHAASRVDGAFTARVLDADPDGHWPYLVTEHIDGPTLERAVTATGPLEPTVLLAVAVGVAEALAAIHAAGVIHRDLKPSNVLLAADGPKVIDFGVAHAMQATRLTRSRNLIGTPSFMAPEQFSNGPVTATADIFAWGSLITYAATGHPPFGDGIWHGVAYRILHTAPDLDGIPAGPVRAAVASALAKEPAARPDATALLATLLGVRTPTQQRAAATNLVASTWDPTGLPPTWATPTTPPGGTPQPGPTPPGPAATASPPGPANATSRRPRAPKPAPNAPAPAAGSGPPAPPPPPPPPPANPPGTDDAWAPAGTAAAAGAIPPAASPSGAPATPAASPGTTNSGPTGTPPRPRTSILAITGAALAIGALIPAATSLATHKPLSHANPLALVLPPLAALGLTALAGTRIRAANGTLRGTTPARTGGAIAVLTLAALVIATAWPTVLPGHPTSPASPLARTPTSQPGVTPAGAPTPTATQPATSPATNSAGQPASNPTTPPGSQPTPSGPTAALQLTAATLQADTDSYRGPCPAQIGFTGHIAVDGPQGDITYQFARSDGSTTPPQILPLPGTGPRSGDVHDTWALGSNGNTITGWDTIRVLGPPTGQSNQATITLTCASPTTITIHASLRANPTDYHGRCPATITFTGAITSDQPATVTYQFIRSNGAATTPQAITFRSPGQHAVRDTWALGSNGATITGWDAIKVLSPTTLQSNQATFTLTCNGHD